MVADRLDVHIGFLPPDKRRRDLDNCIASAKACIDGVADAIGVDDSRWRMSFTLLPEQTRGAIVITIHKEDNSDDR